MIDSIIIPRQLIQQSVQRLGNMINGHYADRDPVLICMLSGGFVFFGDLVKYLAINHQIDFMKIAAYGDEQTPGKPKLELMPTISLEGRDVLIVDDILDTGRTVALAKEIIDRQEPAAVNLCVLVDKKAHREHDIHTLLRGFEISDVFCYGYGMDLQGRGRTLPDIYAYGGS